MRDALIKLHVSVFLAGFTGVLGALIQLNEGLLVWYRIAITVVSLMVLLQIKKQFQRIPVTAVWQLLGIGTLNALHWVFFYGSIKIANVSIGLLCFASTGFFTALLEPVFNKKKFSIWDVTLGLISLAGILLIFRFDHRYREGIMAGIVSAILAALFTVLNKKQVNTIEPRVMMVYELSGGLLLLTLLMPLYLYLYPVKSVLPSLTDWFWLLILGWFCTLLAMNLMLQALQKVSAFTQNLSLNLEPVYGIVLAFVLFGEQKQLGKSFYIGVLLITFSVVLQMIKITRQHRYRYAEE